MPRLRMDRKAAAAINSLGKVIKDSGEPSGGGRGSHYGRAKKNGTRRCRCVLDVISQISRLRPSSKRKQLLK